jgi:hypothetical protein
VTGAKGHPRRHVARLGKAEKHAEEEGKTKSVFTNTEQQDKGVKDVLASAQGQAQLALLDAAPPAAQKTVPGEVKDWELRSGSATKASVIVESTGSGGPATSTSRPLIPSSASGGALLASWGARHP